MCICYKLLLRIILNFWLFFLKGIPDQLKSWCEEIISPIICFTQLKTLEACSAVDHNPCANWSGLTRLGFSLLNSRMAEICFANLCLLKKKSNLHEEIIRVCFILFNVDRININFVVILEFSHHWIENWNIHLQILLQYRIFWIIKYE